jgi:hypothetical protein
MDAQLPIKSLGKDRKHDKSSLHLLAVVHPCKNLGLALHLIMSFVQTSDKKDKIMTEAPWAKKNPQMSQMVADATRAQKNQQNNYADLVRQRSEVSPAAIAAGGSGGAGGGGPLFAGLTARNGDTKRKGEPQMREFAPVQKTTTRYSLFYNGASGSSVNQINTILTHSQHPHPQAFDWSVHVVDTQKTHSDEIETIISELHKFPTYQDSLQNGVVIFDNEANKAFKGTDKIVKMIIDQKEAVIDALIQKEMTGGRDMAGNARDTTGSARETKTPFVSRTLIGSKSEAELEEIVRRENARIGRGDGSMMVRKGGREGGGESADESAGLFPSRGASVPQSGEQELEGKLAQIQVSRRGKQ